MPADNGTLGRNDPLEWEAKRGVYAPGFLDTRVQVREFPALFPSGKFRESAALGGCTELVQEPLQRCGMGQETMEDGTE